MVVVAIVREGENEIPNAIASAAHLAAASSCDRWSSMLVPSSQLVAVDCHRRLQNWQQRGRQDELAG